MIKLNLKIKALVSFINSFISETHEEASAFVHKSASEMLTLISALKLAASVCIL